MGIPGLFRTILKKYPNTIEWKFMKTDYYFMDFNSFMHITIGKYISKNKEKLYKLSQTKIENEIIKDLIKKTQEIVNIVKPQKLLYIAIDGSAPLAKISQQRARRYKGILMSDYVNVLRKKYKIKKELPVVNSDVWDSVGISPGTKFMKKVSTAFQKAIKSGKFCKHLKDITDFKIMFSDTSMPGEAEHKIMMFIRMLIEKSILKKSDKITIYSEDADLIVLNFSYNYEIRIQRPVKSEDRDKYPKELPNDVNYVYFLVNEFKVALIKEVRWEKLNIDRLVYDYIFLSLMGGNDFVKPLPYLKVNTKLWGKDGLSNIINYYNNVRQPDQYLINNNFTVNTPIFKALINEMAKHEDKAMKILYKKC